MLSVAISEAGATNDPLEELFEEDLIDFGQSVQGDRHVTQLVVSNSGFDTLSISRIALEESENFTLTGPQLDDLTLEIGESIVLELEFTPTSIGQFSDQLIIESNSDDSPQLNLLLTGEGTTNAGDVSVKMSESFNGNIGGIDLNTAAPQIVEDFATVTNDGGGLLSIFDIRVTENDDQFAITGLPESVSLDTPLQLNPGESLPINLVYALNKTGLQRGTISVITDDPETPHYTFHIVGTGLENPQTDAVIGHDFIGVESFSDEITEEEISTYQLISDNNGEFELDISPEESYRVTLFDPETGLVATQFGVGASEGDTNQLIVPFWTGSIAPDTDHDGLPDDIEFAIGSDINLPDSNGDGIEDFEALQMQLDPIPSYLRNNRRSDFIQNTTNLPVAQAVQNSPNVNAPNVNTSSAGATNIPLNPLSPQPEIPVSPIDTELVSVVNTLNEAAIALWNSSLTPSIPFDVELQVVDLPLGQLAEAQVTKFNSSGVPIGGTILVDEDASGTGWFIDETPFDHSEFSLKLADWAIEATAGSEAFGRYDLFTTLLHELAHLGGFIEGYAGFDRRVQTIDGSQLFIADDLTVQLNGDHLDIAEHPNDLLNPILSPSLRNFLLPLIFSFSHCCKGIGSRLELPLHPS